MEDILFLKSEVKEKVYGGHKIAEMLKLDTYKDKKIGEYWAISGHPNGESIITNGSFKGIKLNKLFTTHKEIFNKTKVPLLIKLIHIVSPVSVQVHPNNEYALNNENDYGKAEFCLFIDTQENAEVIHGHNAKTKEEFRKLIKNKEFDKLLITKKIVNNDYVFNDAGTVHGLKGELMMLEVQQSSDVTYRIYDYDTVGFDGLPRELHLDKAIEVTKIPHINEVDQKQEMKIVNTLFTHYCHNQYFSIDRYQVRDKITIKNNSYLLAQIISGSGKIVINDEYTINTATPFIITSNTKEFTIEGNLDIILVREGQ
jgi:mannose-6-phosphate isomerase